MRAAIFDVDGVLTDGRLYIGERGEEFKAFSTLDGHGLKLLAQGGITPIVITGRDSPAVRRRVADLGIAHARLRRARQAGRGRRRCCAQLQLDWDGARRDGRRLARPAADGARRLRLRAGQRPRRGAGGRAPRHRGARRPWRGARVLRPAADGRRPLRRAAARPPDHARWTLPESRGAWTDARGRCSPPAAPRPRSRGRASPGAGACVAVAVGLPAAAADGPAGAGHLVAGEEHAAWPARRRVAAPLRHEPDYTMRDFSVQRFSADGPLRAQIEGDALRHYPDTDTLEIDNARLRAVGPDGRVTLRHRAPRPHQRRRPPKCSCWAAPRSCAKPPAGDEAHQVPRRVPACLPRHRARALAPAGDGDARRHRSCAPTAWSTTTSTA